MYDLRKGGPASDGPVGRQLFQDRNDCLLRILRVSRPMRPGTWNWLTNVYTVGVGSICEKAIGELTIVTAAKIRPTATPIHRLFMHLSPWAGLSAAHGNTLEGRSSSLSRNFADGEARRRSVYWVTW